MLIERTLRYLGWHGALDEPMRQLLDSCAQEVRTLRPSFAHARFSLSHDPLRLSEAGIVLPSAQLDRSIGGKEALLQRCQEYKVSLMLDLGDGYYQNLLTGEFYKLAVGSTWPGSADDAATYGELCWTKIGSLPSAPPMDWGSRESST